MKGDFARMTFDPRLHFSQVLHQQGRVLLEADWNEQGAIQLHLLRSLIVDLIGPCWAAGAGFEISQQSANNATLALKDWRLSPGHFYVDGILCQNESECTLASQPSRPTPDGDGFENPPDRFMLYLDVWERHLSALEAPQILDLALGGIDTATRAQVVWQVRMLGIDAAIDLGERVVAALRQREDLPPFAQELIAPDFNIRDKIGELFDNFAAEDEGDREDACNGFRILLGLRNEFACPQIKAGLGPIDGEADACIIAPDARYRGCENQLYRVEIHAGGLAWDGQTPGATFKWSRENGSVIFPIVSPPTATGVVADGMAEYVIGLGHLGRDARLGVAVGDWVELSDDTIALMQRAHPLLRVIAIDSANRTVTVRISTGSRFAAFVDMNRRPLLRRWDQREDVGEDGALPVREDGDGMELEDGVTISFEPGAVYATGDYWVIPARVAGNGSLDWPMDGGEPRAVKAKGLHHYAALGAIDDQGVFGECCCRVTPLCDRRARRPVEATPRPAPGIAKPSNAPRDAIARDAARTAKPGQPRRKPASGGGKAPPTP